MTDIKYPTADELIEVNRRVLQLIRVKRGDRPQLLASKATLEALLQEVRALEGDIYEKGALLLSQLVRRHVFASGNRRTAFMATHAFLDINGASLRVPDDPETVKVLTGIREGFYTRDDVKRWLQGREIRPFRRSVRVPRARRPTAGARPPHS